MPRLNCIFTDTIDFLIQRMMLTSFPYTEKFQAYTYKINRVQKFCPKEANNNKAEAI